MNHPILTIVPNMGWNDGVNLEIVSPDTVDSWDEDSDAIFFAPKIHATMNTLIVKVRDVTHTVNRYYLGFLPEEGIYVLVPAWIFWDKGGGNR